MSSVQYNLISVNGQGNITVVVDGEMFVANSEHSNWKGIVEGAVNSDPHVVDLFDQTVAVAKKFERLSDRVTVSNGRVFLDGDEVNNALTEQIVRFLDADEDFGPLVDFYENLLANPQAESREMLYGFLATHDFTITDDGCFIGYKGVRKTREGEFTSIRTGPAIVNNEAVDGYVPNHVGAVVEMPRSGVAFDPDVACSTGLHVGTYAYATDFAQGATLTVKVNPRDVVSVPSDHNNAKVRVCRYEVLEVNERQYTEPVIYHNSWVEDDDDEVEEYCFVCADFGHDSSECPEEEEEYQDATSY